MLGFRCRARRTRQLLLILIAVLVCFTLLLNLMNSSVVEQMVLPSAVLSPRQTSFAGRSAHEDDRPTPPHDLPANFSADCSVLPPNFGASNRHITRHSPQISASCELLFQGNYDERRRVRQLLKEWKNSVEDNFYLKHLSLNCTKTRELFYNNFYTSKVEREFPLAYIFLYHYKEGVIHQYLRLLKVFYRPHNVYCIHLDVKSPIWWKVLVDKFASCFPNIIIVSKVDVVYATVRILHAHLTCFRELLKTKLPWRYAINLHGTEVPLATNRVLVDLTRSMNGVNIIDKGMNLTEARAKHAKRKFKYSITWNTTGNRFYRMRSDFHTPFNITLFKSAASANSALTREFVGFMLTDARAKALHRYLLDFESAVELFFSTVNHFPDAPGNVYLLEKGRKMPLLAQRIWKAQTLAYSPLCLERKLHHRICIVSASDLPWLRSIMDTRTFYFLNKYWIEYDHVVMDCIEDLLVQGNVEEYSRDCTRTETGLDNPLQTEFMIT